MKARPPMKLTRTRVGTALLPMGVFLVACGSSSGGGTPGASGSTGSGGHATSGGSVSQQAGAGSFSGSFGGAGSGSFGGAGSPASAGNSASGAGGSANGTAGVGPSGGTGGVPGGFGGKSGGLGGKGGGFGGAGGGATGGGASGGGATGGAPALDCSKPMPTGGTTVTSNNKTGKAAGLDWALWSNLTDQSTFGSITTFDVPAFSAKWNNSGDYLARIGLQWNASKTFAELGTVTAQFAVKKSGDSGGKYSYIGVYGWSVSPCIEWYIIDQSYGTMPVTPGGTTVTTSNEIDGAKYRIVKRTTTGTGGSKCPGTNSWDQYYSIRMSGRDCGQISVTEHFKAWAANNLPLGKMDQAQILIEVGGGTGTADFSVANVTLTPP